MEADLPRYSLFIDGAAVPPSSGQYFATEDPFSGKAWAQVARANAADVDVAVKAAHRAFTSGAWPAMSATERGHALWRLGDLIVANAERLARDRAARQRQAVERGRRPGEVHGRLLPLLRGPRRQGRERRHPDRQEGRLRVHALRAEGRRRDHHAVELAADADELEARAGARGRLHRGHQAVRVHVRVDGRVRRAVRARRASRTASSTSSPASAPRSASRWSLHPHVAHIGFTGGDAAGRKIYELAARNLKTVTLELGGKSPNIVFDDADLDQAVKGAVSGIFAAAGQSCQAGSRLLVQRSIHDEFVDRLIAFVQAGASSATRRCPTRRSGRSRRGRSSTRSCRTSRSRSSEGATLRAAAARRGPDLGAGHVRRADDLHRRAQRHAHRAGGGVRAGAVGDPVRRRGGRDPHRQRHRLRARGRRLDPRPAPRDAA